MEQTPTAVGVAPAVPECSAEQKPAPLIVFQAPQMPIPKQSAPIGSWKKREITIQEKIVEYTKIDEDGETQFLVEKEKQQLEVVHMETDVGEFAHHEVTHFEQFEKLNDEVLTHETGKEEFVHLKSKHDEFSHFESSMPQQTEECEAPPPSPSLKPGEPNPNEPNQFPMQAEPEDPDYDYYASDGDAFESIPEPRVCVIDPDQIEPNPAFDVASTTTTDDLIGEPPTFALHVNGTEPLAPPDVEQYLSQDLEDSFGQPIEFTMYSEYDHYGDDTDLL